MRNRSGTIGRCADRAVSRAVFDRDRTRTKFDGGDGAQTGRPRPDDPDRTTQTGHRHFDPRLFATATQTGRRQSRESPRPPRGGNADGTQTKSRIPRASPRRQRRRDADKVEIPRDHYETHNADRTRTKSRFSRPLRGVQRRQDADKVEIPRRPLRAAQRRQDADKIEIPRRPLPDGNADRTQTKSRSHGEEIDRSFMAGLRASGVGTALVTRRAAGGKPVARTGAADRRAGAIAG
jgi:hypothetical protein